MDEKLIDKIIESDGVDIDPFTQYTLTDFHWRNSVTFVGEEKGREAFNKGKLETKEVRAVGKTLGLALCYGGSFKTVQRAYPDKTVQECIQMANNFYQTYRALSKHLEKVKKYMYEHGYIKNLLGRKIPIEGWDVVGSNWEQKKQRISAENDASNYPIQSLGGEIIRLIVIATGKWTEKGNLNKLVGNNSVKKYISRIVTCDEQVYNDNLELLNEQPEGNTIVLVTKDNKVLGEYDRYISFCPNIFPDMKIYL